MPRGRPANSIIRQNIIEILYYFPKAHGYIISKIYNELFAPVTRRSIYYHLKKGVKLYEFEVNEIKEEVGEYSWGSVVEKIYYSLGREATPKGLKVVKDYMIRNGFL